MVRAAVKGIVAIWLTLAALPSPLFAQQGRNPAPVTGLLKSIGLAKPAITRAPEFSLRELNGNVASLSGYRGKMVLLNFWATWCGPCRDEMPSMEQLSRNFGGQGLAVVAINQRENAALVARFMKTHNLNFSTLLDTDGRVAASYRVYGIPVSYVIDADGQAIGMKSGSMDWASPRVVDMFRELVDETNSGVTTRSIGLEPAMPMPKVLRVKRDEIVIRGRHDNQSEALVKLKGGDELVPLGKVSGAGEFWYMVKTKKGTVGWVREADVDASLSILRP
jgi:thiol-disulfide isomerase/thioredoxin